MSSRFFSSHKGFLYQQMTKRRSREKCTICDGRFIRSNSWNKKYCPSCESIYLKKIAKKIIIEGEKKENETD